MVIVAVATIAWSLEDEEPVANAHLCTLHVTLLTELSIVSIWRRTDLAGRRGVDEAANEGEGLGQ